MTTYDLTPLQVLLRETAEPAYIAKICDEACFNIAKLAIVKPDDFIYGSPDDQLYYLRAMRDIFSAMQSLKESPQQP